MGAEVRAGGVIRIRGTVYSIGGSIAIRRDAEGCSSGNISCRVGQKWGARLGHARSTATGS
jgi:hypothetical protein